MKKLSVFDFDTAAKPKSGERRQQARSRTFWRGRLKTGRGEFDCRVVDMSPQGVKLRLTNPVDAARNEPVTLIIDGLGEFRGVIVWHRNNDAGMHTTVRLDAPGRQQESTVEARTAKSAPVPGARIEPQLPMLEAAPISLETRSMPTVAAAPVQTPPGMSREERDRIEAAVAVIHPEIFHQIRSEVATAMPRPEFERQISTLVTEIASSRKLALTGKDHALVSRRIIDEMVGFGPLEPLLADDSISDILVNGPHSIYVERDGKLQETGITFTDDQHVLNVAMRIVTRAGRRVDESSPLVDARLPDGSRINVIIPPLSTRGPMMSIRKFSRKGMTLDHMVHDGCMSPGMAALLKIAARCRLNVLISGGTGAGKTTLLNAVSQMIDPAERIITIEDAAELQLQLPHVGSLETRPPNLEAKGEVTIRDLVRNALRMRPDRIILGEVRGAEAFDMLQAMNTGHDGSLGTIHASGPREALTRLENIVAMCGMELPVRFIRSQIASALHLIVQLTRMRDGKRRITSITEIVGMEGDIITTQELFRYDPSGENNLGQLVGNFIGAQLRPHFMPRAEYYGLGRALQHAVFAPDQLNDVLKQLQPAEPRPQG